MDNNLDLITIAIPVYNVESYLVNCVESVLNQTYKKIEIILVNDGSTDSSLEICKKYDIDDRVIIIDKINEGLSSARQVGIDNAKGHYICFTDSDDYIEKDFIEKLYHKISTEKSDICICSSRFYGEDVDKTHGFNDENTETRQLTKQDIEEKYFSLIYIYYMSDSWNKMYRTEFIRKTSIKFSLKKEFNGTDLSFNHRLMLHLPKISVVNEPLYNHQILENSRVRRKNKQLQRGFMIIMSQIISEVNKLNYSNSINKQLNSLYAKFLREAAQDIYNSTVNCEKLKEELDYLQKNNNQYLENNKRVSLHVSNVESKSLKFFCWCLHDRSNKKLLVYLKLRRVKSVLRNKLSTRFK